jgi:transposase-like protein
MDKQTQKEAIIAEYLAVGTSYRKLSIKYGIKHQAFHEWVPAFQGKRKQKIKCVNLYQDYQPKCLNFF